MSNETKTPMFEYGEFSRYKNEDSTTSCYRNLKFIGAFENTSIFCDLYGNFAREITELKAENEKLRKALEEFDNDDNWAFVNKGVDTCFIGKYDPRVFATMALKGTPLDNTQEGEQVSTSEFYKNLQPKQLEGN